MAVNVAIGGLLIGLMFGWTVYRTNFCVMGALSDVVNLGDARRLRAWILAVAVALLATQALTVAGFVALERAAYLAPRLNWLGAMVGGVAFGFGMVLAGGCPTRNLVRCASGDLRALIVLLVVAIAGFATISGLIAPARDAFERWTVIDLTSLGMKTQSLGALAASFAAIRASTIDAVMAVLIGFGAVGALMTDHSFRTSKIHVASGLIVGALVTCGWLVTGLSYDEFAASPVPLASLTFIRPLGDTLDWVQRFTATPWPGFGVSSVLGTLLGAHGAARTAGRLRPLGFASLEDLQHNLYGAVLMGIGGVLSLGCTIGQGVTGLSTLALGSMVTTAALVVGGLQGLRYLERCADV